MNAPVGWNVRHADGSKLYLKVSEKGGVSLYGLGRFPVTLYAEQWAKLLARADDIASFINTHVEQLAFKDAYSV